MFNNISKEEFLPSEIPVLEEIGQVAVNIAYHNFDWRFVTLVIHNNLIYVAALQTFLKYYSQSIILKNGKYIPRKRLTIPQFVIFGNDLDEIIDMIMWLDKSKYDNSGKYIVICTSSEIDKCKETNVFAVFLRMHIINVVYIRLKSDNEFELFSYDIILPEKCLNSQPYKMDIHLNCTMNDCFKSLYPMKLKNFYKCPLIISTFSQPPFMILDDKGVTPSGGGGELINLLIIFLNATLILKIPEEGDHWGYYHDGNWTGSLGDVYNDRAHMSVCSVPPSVNTYNNFSISDVYNSVDIVWTTSISAQKPSWEKLLNPLDKSVRIGLFLMFASIATINAITRLDVWIRIRKMLNIESTRSSFLFYSWSQFLGIPILKMPSNTSLLLLVYSWIWYCFVIRSAYQAALMTSLKQQLYEDSFPNFDSALKNRHPYGGLSTLREYYTDDNYIYENWQVLDFNKSYETLNDISEELSDFVLAFNKENIIDVLIFKGGDNRVQILPQKIVNGQMVIYFKKHSGLVNEVNRFLSFTIETGFTQMMHTKYLRHKKYVFENNNGDNYHPLTMDNFKSCIIFVVFGWLLAFVFFVVEIYCGHLDNEKY